MHSVSTSDRLKYVRDFNAQISRDRIALIEKALNQRPMNMHDLSDAIKMTPRWVNYYLTHLRNNDRVFVLRYVRRPLSNYMMLPEYAWGKGTDAPRPLPKRANRQSASADETHYWIRQSAARVPKRDYLVAAFFGEAGTR